MSSDAPAAPGWQPWSQRFYAIFPVAPLWVGVGLVALVAVVLFVSAVLSGDLQAYRSSGEAFYLQRDARLVVILCILAGFLPTSQEYLVRFTRKNLAALEPRSAASAGLRLPRPSFWWCTVPGVLVMPVIAFSIDRDLSLYLTRDYLDDVTHYFQWAFGLFVTLSLAHSTHLSVACGRAVGRQALALPRIDLLDLSPLAPVARQMLQTVLVWLLMLSIFAVNAVDPGFAPAVAVVAVYTGVVVWVLWQVTNRELHGRIRQTKARELERINDALRGDRTAAASLGIAGQGGQLGAADLLAYRQFVAGVREWALDTSAWLRIALYLAIPLGSWLGGAIVERLLDASLR